MIITITEDELQRCGEWGAKRTQENANTKDIADYDPLRFNLTPQQNNKIAVLAEYAVYKYLGFNTEMIYPYVWSPFVPRSEYKKFLGQPDIMGKVEVRRANRRGNPVPIRAKDRDCEAYIVQAYVPYTQPRGAGTKIYVQREVHLTGWVDAVEDYDTAETPSWAAGDTKVQKELRNIATLFEALKMEEQYVS